LVEFLELGVSVNGQRTWQIMGPDLNGRYGGLNGVGGLEATVQETGGGVTPVLNDYFGNVLATINSQQLTINWSPLRVSGYGPVGYQAPVLSTGTPLAQSLLWRTRRMDPSGLYYLGARYYDPIGRHFVSPDPLGHAASLDLYSFCGNDPVNGFDADGRFGKSALNDIRSSVDLSYYNAPTKEQVAVQQFLTDFANVATLGIANDASKLFTGYDLYGSRVTSQDQNVAAFMLLVNLMPGGSVERVGAKMATRIGDDVVIRMAESGVITDPARMLAAPRQPIGILPEKAESIFTAGEVSPSFYGLKTIAEDSSLLRMWNSSLKSAASSTRANGYTRYLNTLESGGTVDQTMLEGAFKSVNGYFLPQARSAGYDIARVHHWNFSKSQFPNQVLDPRNLVPVESQNIHELLHRLTTGNTSVWNGPIAPQNELFIPNISTPLN
jgi:RHS repeat-associated protein